MRHCATCTLLQLISNIAKLNFIGSLWYFSSGMFSVYETQTERKHRPSFICTKHVTLLGSVLWCLANCLTFYHHVNDRSSWPLSQYEDGSAFLSPPQYDCHPCQCWSCQYSERWTGDHVADPDGGRLAHPGHQSAHRCGLAAVSQVSDRHWYE